MEPLFETKAPVMRECDGHGQYESRNIIRDIWTKCPKCEEIRRAAEAKAEQEARQQAAIRRAEAERQKMLGRAAIPGRFIGRSFENFEAENDNQRRALTACRDYSEQFETYAARGCGLILSGKPGTGKSHLAAAILQAHMHREVLYATCLDVVRMVRETWRRDSEKSERQVLQFLCSLDLLVIDEMGVQYGTDGEQTILFDVLDGRYRDMKPTVLLTNQDAEGLKAYIGDRTYDRLRETCKFIPFEWASYRPKARAAH